MPDGAFIRDGKVFVPGMDVRTASHIPRRVAPLAQKHAGSAYIGPGGKIVYASEEGRVVTYIVGMHGFGDCVHQRAQVRHYLSKGDVYLSTPWPCLYHDLEKEGLILVKPNSGLYTQAKNERLENSKFKLRALPADLPIQTVRTGYVGGSVIEHGSIVAAMCHNLSTRDFSLPVPDQWKLDAKAVLLKHGIRGDFAIVRPLTKRAEYPHLLERNPEHAAYIAICAQVRERMPLVSVADLSNPSIEAAECDPEADQL